MDLFAPSYAPQMVASHQPQMSGLSQPTMAPARTFGPSTPVHFGTMPMPSSGLVSPHTHAPLVSQQLHAAPAPAPVGAIPTRHDPPPAVERSTTTPHIDTRG